MNNVLLVGLGGAAGSMLRYLVQRWIPLSFPLATLLVNLSGCFIIGMLWGLSARSISEEKRLLLSTGFCGGFTTFSAFSQESVQMISENRWRTFALYLTASVAGGLTATWLGYKITTN